MRKIFNMIYFIVMAILVLSLSGCNGSSSSFVGSSTKPVVKQVAVLTSPVFQQDNDYVMYKGASVTEMDGAKYYVASDVGNDAEKTTLNLGFTEKLDESLIISKIVNNQEKVVFAYNPEGSGDKTVGTLTPPLDGKRLKYDGLTIASSFFTSINVETGNAKVIVLDSETGKATIDGAEIPEYDYIWHVDPSYLDEYFTLGSSSEKLTKKQVKQQISEGVYVARDIRYMPNTINFTGTATKDGESEYAAYYSDEVAAEIASEYGSEFAGPYIFATLPTNNGMGGAPGGFPGRISGDTPPNFPGRDTRQNLPMNFRTSTSNSDVALFSTMTHSASEAYANRVLHITEPGVYSLKGTWKGQIWIEIGEESSDKAAIILNGVTVSCDVAPALVFKEVYECGPDDDENEVASSWKTLGNDVLNDAGAMVIIADDTVNNFTGTNVYRLMKAEPKSSATKVNGSDISDQKKRYKMDGAFYSFMSLAMAGGAKANGILNVTSTTYEGLDVEIHMALESGVVNVNAVDDGMNFNEDDISVFTMLGGTLTVSSQNGDGIDSNGYVYVNGGTLNITAGSQKIFSAGEAGIDAEDGCEVTSNAIYNWNSASGGWNNTPTNPTVSGDVPPNIPSEPNSNDNPDEPVIENTETIIAPNGTTTVNIALGSTNLKEDTDTSPRGIAETSNIFRITRKVNTFSGITVEN